MSGRMSSSWWVMVLWVIALLALGASAAIHTRTVALKVQGMAWPFCALTVESVLQKVEGVLTADASFIKGQAVVTYDPDRTSPQAIIQALNTQTLYRASVVAGDNFRTRTQQIALLFEPDFDQQRTWKIGMGLKSLTGVTDVNALTGGRVGITFDPLVVDTQQIVSVVEGMGYTVLGIEPLSPPQKQTEDREESLPYFLVSSPFILGIGLFVYRRHHRARKSLVTTKASPRRREDTS